MLQRLMNGYGNAPPRLRAWLRHWIVMPGKRLLSRGVIAQDGFVVAKRLDQSIPFHLWRHKCYEPALSALFRRSLRSGDTFIDVGANIGYFTLLAAACVGPSGHVHSFEPNPQSFNELERNIALNGFRQVTRNNLVLSNESGIVQLWVGPEVDSGLVSLRPTSPLLTQPVTSRATTLDEYVLEKQCGKIRAMKLDVEGAEWLVLQGAQKLLSSPDKPDLISVELIQSHASAFGATTQRVAEFVAQHAYELYQLLEQSNNSFRLQALKPNAAQIDMTLVAIAQNNSAGMML